jgi:RNA polymerase sigma-70 factor, ECF subfamily
MDARQEIEACIVSRYDDMVRLARWFTHDADVAHDVVQDTICRALSHPDQYQPGTRVWKWLKTILRNAYFNHRRNIQNHKTVSYARLDLLAEDEPVLQIEPVQDACIADHEVEQLITALRPEWRQVIDLMGFGGCSYQQASLTLGLPVGTVKSRYARAKLAVRERYH